MFKKNYLTIATVLLSHKKCSSFYGIFMVILL